MKNSIPSTPPENTRPAGGPVSTPSKEASFCNGTINTVSPQLTSIATTAGIFDPLISMVDNVKQTETTTKSLRTVLGWIRNGGWEKEVKAVRDAYAKSGKKAADDLKLKLPALLPSGDFKRRSKEDLKQHSGIICADIDLAKNPKLNTDLAATRAAIEADPHTLAVFLSPTGTGLKVLCRCDPERPHIESYRAAEKYFREHFDITIDASCSDVSRLCIVSHDPDLFERDDAEPLPYATTADKNIHEKIHNGGGTPFASAANENGPIVEMPDDFGAATVEEVQAKLSCIPSRPSYPDWLRILSAVFATLPFGEALAALEEWSPEEKPGEYAEKFRHRLTDVGFGTLVHYAQQNGYKRNALRNENATIRPFTLWSPGQFANYVPDLSANLLGDGYLLRGEFTSFVGIGGLGKTRLTLWLAIRHITGQEWCGLATHGGPLRWLFLSTESGLRRWKGDLDSMFAVLTKGQQAEVERHLKILALTPDEDGNVNLGDRESVERLALTLQQEKPGVIVLDPFADTVDGDENLAVDVVRSLRVLRSQLRKNAPEAAAIIVHHSRTGNLNIAQAGDNYQGGNFGRGSKALFSRVRCELQLAPGDRKDPDRLVLCCGKANDCKRFEPRGITFDEKMFIYQADPQFDIEAWRSDVLGKRNDAIVSITDVVAVVGDLAAAGTAVEFPTSAIVQPLKDQTGASAKTVLRRLQDAVKGGYLKVGSKRGNWAPGPNPAVP